MLFFFGFYGICQTGFGKEFLLTIFNDFYCYYIGSFVFWQGENPYNLMSSFHQVAQKFKLHFLYGSGFTYPTLLALVFKPLLLLPPYTAAEVWAIINISLYLYFCWLIYKNNTNNWLLIYLF